MVGAVESKTARGGHVIHGSCPTCNTKMALFTGKGASGTTATAPNSPKKAKTTATKAKTAAPKATEAKWDATMRKKAGETHKEMTFRAFIKAAKQQKKDTKMLAPIVNNLDMD
jgi:hypothetical protein